jgi:D-alanyl-D-alanine dipeptidase/carboxypeptidase
MKKNDLCMEEYIPFIKQFAYGEQKYNFTVAQKNFSVSYLPASEAEVVCIEIAEDVPYTISGNNIDGYIITEWR